MWSSGWTLECIGTCCSKRELYKGDQRAGNNPQPLRLFFMQSDGNAVIGKQAYFSQSMARLRHLTCDMLEE